MIFLGVLSLSACSSSGAREALGIGRQSPDEFAVVERAPLTMPPSYQLKEPRPGAPRPQEISPTEQARALITGANDQVNTTGLSDGESALLQKASAGQINPNIRQVLNDEYGIIPEGGKKERTIDKLIPIGNDSTKGNVIDPTEEAETLRENGVNAPKPVTHTP